MGNQPAAADAHRCTAAAVRRGMLHGAWSCRPWDNGPFNHPDDAPTHRPTLTYPCTAPPPHLAPLRTSSALRCACSSWFRLFLGARAPPPGAGGTSVGVSPLSETRTARDRFAQIGLALRQFAHRRSAGVVAWSTSNLQAYSESTSSSSCCLGPERRRGNFKRAGMFGLIFVFSLL